jgi:YidC/Oxa1 family membrane protein insertase
MIAGPLAPLEDLLRSVLDFFHGSVGLTWAWAIVALTICVRILLVPLVVRQIHSMQSLQAHAPQMKEIQKRYKGDRARMNEELMKFYRENNINPMASCLPLLAQFPIFIALFYVLRDFSEHVPDNSSLSWLGVVPDISQPANSHWSGYLLIVIYAISQVSSTFFMSTTMDKTQRYLLLGLPIFFLPIVIRFPTGLVLYWMTTNLWTVGQGLVTRRLAPKPQLLEKRSSRTAPKDLGDEDGDGAKREPPKPKPTTGQAQPRVVRRKKKKKARR